MLACAWYNAGKYNNHVLLEIRNKSYIQKFFVCFKTGLCHIHLDSCSGNKN